jgi:hypothetical protein
MPDDLRLEIASILGAKTKQGLVEITIIRDADTREIIRIDLPKAREILAMLSGAIEAAVSDELIFKFLTTRVGVPEMGAAAALLELRDLRQGSRGAVYPQ